MQWRLFEADTVPVHTTAPWYGSRDRAAHLEQPGHRERLLATARLVSLVCVQHHTLTGRVPTVVDLGCGDGGLLQLLKETPVRCVAWGYDLQPTNVNAARAQRGVDVRYGDILGPDVVWGQIAVVTEVLEHLLDPHAFVREIARHCPVVVASSPAFETDTNAYPFHTWAFDVPGYAELFTQAGYTVREQRIASGAQLLWASHRVASLASNLTKQRP
jgi:2-polyprenyl-3-methyl-5-hydroxy-6-metoxy-1,4-benzoquinol methylase